MSITKSTPGEKVFDLFNYLFMILLVIVTLYPLYFVLCASVSSNTSLQANPGILIKPLGFTLGAFRLAFRHPLLLSGYKNIFFILVGALPLNLIMTLLCGYFMASKKVLLKKYVVAFFMFTMFFSGGLIPSFLNQKELGLYNNLWALIIPGALSLFNAIITKTAIEAIPDSLMESAGIDGANDLVILFRIITPLVLPTLAVMLLYYGVGHWNSWFPATIYLKDMNLMPLQAVLRSLLIANSNILNASEVISDKADSYAETIKYAAIVISTVPVLFAYPFLQKYFVKGVMIGAVKG